MISALYGGVVTHARLRPRRHRLRYRVMQGLFDLDELPRLGQALRLFAHNRAGLFSFHDRDHGDGSGDLKGWVARQLAAAGVTTPLGAVQVLCMPRMLGYAFNPLSVYFCHAENGALIGLVYEVNNTYGERHAYALPASPGAGLIRQHCDKAFYVSPFMQMALRYDFAVSPPRKAVGVRVAASDRDGLVLDARFSGRRRDLTEGALLMAFITYPAMTLKVIFGIHWEALKIWLDGIPFVARHTPGVS